MRLKGKTLLYDMVSANENWPVSVQCMHISCKLGDTSSYSDKCFSIHVPNCANNWFQMDTLIQAPAHRYHFTIFNQLPTAYASQLAFPSLLADSRPAIILWRSSCLPRCWHRVDDTQVLPRLTWFRIVKSCPTNGASCGIRLLATAYPQLQSHQASWWQTAITW